MNVRQMRNEARGRRVVKALETRNMEAYYAGTKEEAVKKALELIPEGSTINMGGSASVPSDFNSPVDVTVRIGLIFTRLPTTAVVLDTRPPRCR